MKKEIVDEYENTSHIYDKDRFGTAGGRVVSNLGIEIVRKLVQPRNKKILDVGCGTGRFSIDLYEHGGVVTGVDAASNMIKVARSKNSHVRFETGDVFDLKYKDRSFDAVTAIKIIMHLFEYRDALKEMSRVVKNDGVMVFEIPNRRCIWSLLMNARKRFFYKAAHEHKIKKPSFTYAKIKKDLSEMGLTIDMSVGMFYLPETLFRKSPKAFLPIFYRIERFLRFLPAHWSENIYLRVVKCGKT